MHQSAKARTDEWRIVYRAIGQLAAQAIQGRLETAGVPVILDYDGTTALLGIPTLAGTGEVRVLVPLDWLPEARELLGSGSGPTKTEGR